jgi:uncharacterized membrane-anchored protein YitT (DUF2179 family)
MSMRKSMLICVVRRANTPELKSLIERADPPSSCAIKRGSCLSVERIYGILACG